MQRDSAGHGAADSCCTMDDARALNTIRTQYRLDPDHDVLRQLGYSNWTVWHHAVEHGDLEMMEWLWAGGHADMIDVPNRERWTPLHLALAQKQEAAVRRLVAWGANVSAITLHGATVFAYSCEHMSIAL